MRPTSKYLAEVKVESVKAKYNLAGSTPPSPLIKPRGLRVEWSEQDASPWYKKVIRKLAKMSKRREREVVVVPGSSQALFQAVAALTTKGDVILIEDPTYEPFLAIARFLGLKVRRFKRTDDGKKDFLNLRRRAKGAKVILISNPHAPSGALYSRRALLRLASIGPTLIVDEVYLPHFQGGQITLLHHRNIVNVGGLSKSLGISNVRFGWIFCEPKIGERIRRVGQLLHIDMPVPSLSVAAWALARWKPIIKRNTETVSKNRRVVRNFARRHPGHIAGDFENGNLILLKIPRSFKSSRQFAERLLKRDSIWVRAGAHFGADRFVRVNAMATPTEFSRAWKKIEAYYA